MQSFGAEQIGHTRWPTNIFAHACVEVKHISIPFSCIPSRNKAEIGATSFASLKYSAFMQLTMVHCCGGFGDEQCWVVPWTTNEDFVCITSHARSTAATSFTCAVTSDGVHRIMACWVLLLQSFGAEQHGHTRWPTNIFAHACVEVEHISILVSCVLSRNKAEIGATSFASLKYSAFMQLIMVHWCGGFGDEQ